MLSECQDSLDRDYLYLLSRKLKISQARMAKRFGVIQPRISEAFRGYNPKLLQRIDKYLRKEAERKGYVING
jgi:predicted transcriptional regulator